MGMLVISAFCSTPYVKFFKNIGYDQKKLYHFINAQKKNEFKIMERCKDFVNEITKNSEGSSPAD